MPDDGSVIANFVLRADEVERDFPLRLLLDTVHVECFVAWGRGVASAIGPPVNYTGLWVSANVGGVRLTNATVYTK